MTLRPKVRSVGAVGLGLVLAALACLIWAEFAPRLRERLRESAFDVVLPWLAVAASPSEVLVVDIDRESLARHGPWPWSRTLLAELLTAVATAKPATIGVDILLDEPDRWSPAALARRLGEATARPDLVELAKSLTDGDEAVATAIRSVPTAMGVALDTADRGSTPPLAPVLARTPVDLPRIWRAAGVIGPPGPIEGAAQGFGAMVLASDADGAVRRIPLLVLAGAAGVPGFAVEVVRLFNDAGSLVVETDPPTLRAGATSVRLGPDATLRLAPSAPSAWDKRTVSAGAVMSSEAARERLAGKIVLVGSGAPELGGLRVTPVSSTTPSVQIQADAVETLLSGLGLVRPAWAAALELAFALLLCGAAVVVSVLTRPLVAVLAVAILCGAWISGAIAGVGQARTLVDLAGPPLLGILTFGSTSLVSFIVSERRARAVRRSFEQHLSPEVVSRIVANPALLRLEGEYREVTALFTDIEGFTSMTERADPRELVALLDGYVHVATEIIIRHGGMVDKIVGDAVHALFNAPLDLPDHARHAVACARELLDATEAFRETPLAQKLMLRRTRIGIETGPAIVGDVGGGRKLDYTAHGTVMNTAARLEQANKELGTSICIGPMAAARLPPGDIRSLGAIEVRGRSSPLEVFEPINNG